MLVIDWLKLYRWKIQIEIFFFILNPTKNLVIIRVQILYLPLKCNAIVSMKHVMGMSKRIAKNRQ